MSFSGSETARPTCVDLFAGAGGLSEGLLSAGLHVVASLELHPQPALTHAFNHPGTGVLVGDIRELDLDVLDHIIGERTGAPVDVVAGGPPCQGFSSAGKKAATDPRNSLFRGFVGVIEHVRPRMFLMENVPGFKSMYGGRVYAEAIEAFAALGYETVDDVVVAARYGVPQRRRRFVMVGWLPGEVLPFKWPEATHLGLEPHQRLFGPDLLLTPTAGDALDDLAFLDPGYEATRYESDAETEFAQDRRSGNILLFNHLATRHRTKAVEMFGKIPVGGSIRDVDAAERSLKQTMVRLNPLAVANTVVSLPDDMLHYAHHRILSVRECARLQTFDDDFVFIGKRTSGFTERRVDVPQYTQVGNAVPPLLGRALGRGLLASLGVEPVDLRDVEIRRKRHRYVTGTSGFAGYTLGQEAVEDITLRTVEGEALDLPIDDAAEYVADQTSLRDWTQSGRSGHRGQWAPGVVAKENPSWVGEGASA